MVGMERDNREERGRRERNEEILDSVFCNIVDLVLE